MRWTGNFTEISDRDINSWWKAFHFTPMSTFLLTTLDPTPSLAHAHLHTIPWSPALHPCTPLSLRRLLEVAASYWRSQPLASCLRKIRAAFVHCFISDTKVLNCNWFWKHYCWVLEICLKPYRLLCFCIFIILQQQVSSNSSCLRGLFK